MKITVLACGSRGDVQPPLSLAHHLLVAGHDVTIAAPADFADAARHLGARVAVIPVDAQAMVNRAGLRESLRRGRTLAFFAEAFEDDVMGGAAGADALLAATEGADLLLVPPLVEDLCVSIAEARRQRVALMLPMPFWPNSSYPSFIFSAWPIPRFLNHATHLAMELGTRPLIGIANALRVRLRLPPMRYRPSVAFRAARPMVFYWVPPQVLPPPAEFGPNHVFTGYWAAPREVRAALGEAAPPDDVVRFVAAGPPPVYVGFGSMPVLDEAVIAEIDDATRALGLRVVYGSGWSAHRGEETTRSIVVGALDHDWLFPRCVAAVHHGGASTTGAAIRAGIPAVIASVFADQPFWGRRVRELGIGDTLRFQRLDGPRLRRALARALAPATCARSRMLARELAGLVDGAELTARIIHEHGAGFAIPTRLAG